MTLALHAYIHLFAAQLFCSIVFLLRARNGSMGHADRRISIRRRNGRSGRASVRSVEAGGWTAHYKSKEASRDSALDVLWAKRSTAGDLISLASLLSD